MQESVEKLAVLVIGKKIRSLLTYLWIKESNQKANRPTWQILQIQMNSGLSNRSS